jgi:hypothetical protein
MATWSKASNGQVTPPEAVRKARDKAFAQITAKMAGDDMLSVQGLGTRLPLGPTQVPADQSPEGDQGHHAEGSSAYAEASR